MAQADEIVSSAAKKAKRVQKNKKFLGPAAQARNFTARQMDTLMKELTLPLNRYLKEFPAIEKLHKFEEALLDLTVTSERYNKVLGRILQLRKTTTLVRSLKPLHNLCFRFLDGERIRNERITSE